MIEHNEPAEHPADLRTSTSPTVRSPRSAQTRGRLMDAAVQVIREQGYAAVSARSVAAQADANQALIFYHFDSVANLLAQAFLRATQARVESLAVHLESAQSLDDLLIAGQRIHQAEAAEGNLVVLGQVLAAAHADTQMATAAEAALGLWIEQVHAAVVRVSRTSPLGEVLDPDDLTRLLVATFIGMEMMTPVMGASTDQVLSGLRPLATALDNLGPLTRRAVRSALRPKATSKPTSGPG